MRYTITPIKYDSDLPQASVVSSVFLLAIKGNTIVVTKDKERGWDIPGGHVEENETIEQALRREVYEEAGITFTGAMPMATAKGDGSVEKYRGKIMLIFYTRDYSLSEDFSPADDVTERTVMDVAEFMACYGGDKETMQSILAILSK